MMQRAANNSYSWWYASHIRTKQSKWLDQSLQDMEDQVQQMLKLIEQDGDSFAKRAEMYYKRRPELINSVEEAYRVFRAVAERYDMLSKELHTANHTIATVFPEKIQIAMEEDDDFSSPRVSKNLPPGNESGSPKLLPKPPKKDPKPINLNTKQSQFKKHSGAAEDAITISTPNPKSGMTKPEALEEIDKLQQDICALETVKELVRSSYENGLAKFQDIERRIVELQQRVCKLQDEFGLEEDQARNLIGETALKSCKESLEELQKEQEKCARQADEEQRKIEDAEEKLKSVKRQYLQEEDEPEILNQDTSRTEGLQQKPDGNPLGNLSATELTIKIDELVDKTVTLEITVTSQTALIDRLRTEATDLQAKVQTLEDEKANLVEDKQKLSMRVKELEEQLKQVQNLNRDVENQNKSLQAQLTEALCSIDQLSEKLNTVKPEETEIPKDEIALLADADESDQKEESAKSEGKHVTFAETRTFGDPKPQKNEVENSTKLVEIMEKEEKFNWQKMLLNGVEDREKVLLKEYMTILRIYKDLKKKLDDKEKKDMDSQLEFALQISDLKTAIAKRDEEIQHLREKLNLSTEKQKSIIQDKAAAILIHNPAQVSPVEEKLRTKIDAVLDENLDFWLRFSSSVNKIHKFKTTVKELMQTKEKKANKSEMQTTHKLLKETNTELTTWLKESFLLKEELEKRSSALCRIQEEITETLREGVEEEEIKFSRHQASKFQGEVLNMKQENTKVREELQAGVDHVITLQQDVEKTLKHLDQNYGFLGNHTDMVTSKNNKPRMPLGAYLFGNNNNKQKKQKRSVFCCMHSEKYQVLADDDS